MQKKRSHIGRITVIFLWVRPYPLPYYYNYYCIYYPYEFDRMANDANTDKKV